MATLKRKHILAQSYLKLKGFYRGSIDGLWGAMSNKADKSYIASKVKSTPRKSLASNKSQISPPSPDYNSVTKTFGRAGDESSLVRFTFPYPMTYAGRPMKTHRCHKLIRKPLVAALQEAVDTHGLEWIKEHGLDRYDGCFNFRKSRNSRAQSKHSWGIAIDINAKENGNKTPWNPRRIGATGYANMPLEFIKIMAKHGFKSGGKAWGKDAMHFQYTK